MDKKEWWEEEIDDLRKELEEEFKEPTGGAVMSVTLLERLGELRHDQDVLSSADALIDKQDVSSFSYQLLFAFLTTRNEKTDIPADMLPFIDDIIRYAFFSGAAMGIVAERYWSREEAKNDLPL